VDEVENRLPLPLQFKRIVFCACPLWRQTAPKKLGTDDYQLARRKLADFRRDLGRTDARTSNTSFGAVLEKYLRTIGGLSASSQKDKRAIIGKLCSTWFGIDTLPLRLIKPSDVSAWLSRTCVDKGASYFNSVLTVIRGAFDLAVKDRIIADSPAAYLRYRKRATPIRLTPTFEEFRAIVASIRAQPLNRDAEQSGDFVEFLGLCGLGQAEVRAPQDTARLRCPAFSATVSAG
jgi:hypothetical protein